MNLPLNCFKISSVCEVCATTIIDVLDLGMHPLCDDLKPINSNEACEEYPIQIAICPRCLTAFQKFQIEKRTLFSENYHYRARMTPSVLSGMRDFVDSCKKSLGGLTGKKVLDIGTNDGSLLSFFQAEGAIVLGIEPTSAAEDSIHPIIRGFFDKSTAEMVLKQFGYPDLITFTNVFAHISDFEELLMNLKTIIGRNTRIVIENHYLGAVLDYGQFDTFYHEHPRTYSATSFKYIAEKLDLKIERIEFVSRYGGNIRVTLGDCQSSNLEEIFSREHRFLNEIVQMGTHVEEWKKHTTILIRDLVAKNGKIPAKAFPGRAAILVRILGINECMIEAVYEITGSQKTEHYVPGTNIEIRKEAEFFNKMEQFPVILNLAWHIADDVEKNLKHHGYTGDVVQIKEFKKVNYADSIL